MKMLFKEHIKNAVLGAVTADALGVPYEFKERGSFRFEGMKGFGTHNQKKGTWSDDSSMLLATLVSLTKNPGINLDDIAGKFSDWYYHGSYTPHGSCFDIGNTTYRAIYNFNRGIEPAFCGGRDIGDNGNGSLMRILPIAFVSHTDEDINALSSLTHGHDISTEACRIYVSFIQSLLNGKTKQEALDAITVSAEVFRPLKELSSIPYESLSGSGYVVSTLISALWCFINTDSYRECVTAAIELGEDTDTVAMIAGAPAGIYYGINPQNGIPYEWIKYLAKLDWILEIIKNAENCCTQE